MIWSTNTNEENKRETFIVVKNAIKWINGGGEVK